MAFQGVTEVLSPFSGADPDGRASAFGPHQRSISGGRGVSVVVDHIVIAVVEGQYGETFVQYTAEISAVHAGTETGGGGIDGFHPLDQSGRKADLGVFDVGIGHSCFLKGIFGVEMTCCPIGPAVISGASVSRRRTARTGGHGRASDDLH